MDGGRGVGSFSARVWRRARRGLPAALLLALTLGMAGAAIADTAPIPASSALPWTDPAHGSPLEELSSQIASHIAGRTVSVRCEGDTDWASLVAAQGGDPNAESGFVATTWNPATGQPLTVSGVAELSSGVCLALDRFAAATVKPTKCVPAGAVRAGVRVQQAASATHAGRRAARRTSRHSAVKPGPCYLGVGRTAAAMTPTFWNAYTSYAVAVLTLAHESVHLGGVVGGQLSNGLQVGDPQAEAKADCFGMQWMPYVAVQLGDTPDDAQAIATYFWDAIYPRTKGTVDARYWSAECRPGGALDSRAAGTIAWP